MSVDLSIVQRVFSVFSIETDLFIPFLSFRHSEFSRTFRMQ